MIAVSDAHYVPARAQDIERGLLGFATFRYGDLILEAVVRRTVSGRLYLAFPARSTEAGERISHVRPVDQATRVQLEHAVLDAIGLTGGART